MQNPVLRTDSASVRSFTPQPDSATTDFMFSQVPTEASSAPDFASAHGSTPVQVSTPQAQELAQPVVSYKKIEITDIRRLPKSNWNLCSNRFLIHGFFNYRYLILKTVEQDKEKKQYLGVPGIYEQPERMMALLFGFPEFEAAERQTMNAARQATSSVEQTMNPAGQTTSSPKNMIGIFGYWMCPLN